MNYFELLPSPKVENPIVLTGLDKEMYCHDMSSKQFTALERLTVAYFSGSEREEPCDILLEPTFMVSDELKRLLSMYDKEIAFKGIQALPTVEECGLYPLYWVPYFSEIACIHKDSIVYDNGMLSSLILDGSKIGKRDIFRLSGSLEYKIIVSMPVAESILRRRFYGVGLKKLEVAG